MATSLRHEHRNAAAQPSSRVPENRSRPWLRALLAVGLVVAALASGCSTPESDEGALTRAVTPLLESGAEVDGARGFSGECRDPENLEPAHTGFFSITEPNLLATLWAAQAEGSPPEIAWPRETVIAVFAAHKEMTAIRFHKLIRGVDGTFHAYFIGDTTPLTTARYNFPYCVAVLPVRGVKVNVELLYVNLLPTGGFRVRPRPTALELK